MPRLTAIKAVTKTINVHVPVFNVDIETSYFPGVYTPAFEDELDLLMEDIKRLRIRLEEEDHAKSTGKQPALPAVAITAVHSAAESADQVSSVPVVPTEVPVDSVTGDVYTPLSEEEKSRAKQLANYTVQQLVKLLDSVDITKDDGTRYEINEDNLKLIPYAVLVAIMRAIKDDMIPKEKS